jgi:hypothetical protein
MKNQTLHKIPILSSLFAGSAIWPRAAAISRHGLVTGYVFDITPPQWMTHHSEFPVSRSNVKGIENAFQITASRPRIWICRFAVEMSVRVPRIETLNYRTGGFHPVHLNDTFKKERYTVIHKLGHGGFATVWLARDKIRQRYVALKILAARLSRDCPEVEILRRLRSSKESVGKAFVMSMLDHFWIDGPNGHHLCVVSEVGGPSIKQFNECPGLTSGSRRLRGEVARKVALQATEGLAYIHSTGTVHGGTCCVHWVNIAEIDVLESDFTAANILLQLANIDEWTVEQIHERLGKPRTQDLHRAVEGVDNLSGPRYTISTIDMVSQMIPSRKSDFTQPNQAPTDCPPSSEAGGSSMDLRSDHDHRLWHCVSPRTLLSGHRNPDGLLRSRVQFWLSKERKFGHLGLGVYDL